MASRWAPKNRRGRRKNTDEEPQRQPARRADGPGAVAVPQLAPVCHHARRAELQRQSYLDVEDGVRFWRSWRDVLRWLQLEREVAAVDVERRQAHHKVLRPLEGRRAEGGPRGAALPGCDGHSQCLAQESCRRGHVYTINNEGARDERCVRERRSARRRSCRQRCQCQRVQRCTAASVQHRSRRLRAHCRSTHIDAKGAYYRCGMHHWLFLRALLVHSAASVSHRTLNALKVHVRQHMLVCGRNVCKRSPPTGLKFSSMSR